MKKRIVCFGDSNTWGYNPVSHTRYDDSVRWTGQLQRILGTDYTVIEEGQCGRATVWDDPVENRMAGIKYLWPCMDSHSPFDLLIIMLGTNDTKPYFACSAECIALSAGRLVDLAQKSGFGPNGSAPQVLLVSPIRINEALVPFMEGAEQTSIGFPKAFREVSKQYGCWFLDAAACAEPSKEDGIHLDDIGHLALADAISKMVQEIFQNQRQSFH